MPAHDLLPGLSDVAPTLRRVASGAALFRKGHPTFAIFRVASGKIRLTRVTAGGAEVPVHTAHAGELFAEAALFSAHYHCDAIAVGDSEVLVYPKAEIVRALKMNEEVMWEFASVLAQRVQGLRTQMEIRQVRSARERILQSLRLRADHQGCWQPDGTLKQFAEEIGLTHEALYRALAALEGEGRIRRDMQRICLS
jgi:CRP-like cAMP-binding protein